MSWLLLACLTKVPVSEDDSGLETDADTDADSDTDTDADADTDSDSDADTDPMLDCAEPVDWDMAVEYAPVVAAYQAGTFEISWHSWLYESLLAQDGDCPEVVTTDDSIAFGGDCSTGEIAYSGWMELALPEPGTFEITYDAFEMEGLLSTPDGRNTELQYEANGFMTFVEGDDGSSWTSSVWESRWFEDSPPMDIPEVEGYREVELLFEASEDGAPEWYSWSGFAAIDRGAFDGFAGSYCHEGEIGGFDVCEDEGVGAFHVQGDGYATIRYDGDQDCDGCYQVSVNGGAEEEVCFD